MARIATLEEINTHYDINDALDANELLNLQDNVRRQAEQQSKLNRRR